MIQDSKTTFDQQTKLKFSGTLFDFWDANITSLLVNYLFNRILQLKYEASNLFRIHFFKQKDYLITDQPVNSYTSVSSYFSINALYGRVEEVNFSSYSKVVIEMRDESVEELVEVSMKDIYDLSDDSESKIKIELTDEWKVDEFETTQFFLPT